MQPQFQSSFIPKGPISSVSSSGGAPAPRRRQTDIFSFASSAIFIISLVLAGGVFLYQLFLDYSITQMKGELENARATLEPDTVDSLIRLNSRLVSTESLVKNHLIISPIFDFLEVSTPKTVRYTDMNFTTTSKGPEIVLQGQAVSYAALAAAAVNFDNADTYFANAVFSDLKLDEKGNVVFTFRAQVKPLALSYDRLIKGTPAATVTTPVTTVASSTTSTANQTLPQGNR